MIYKTLQSKINEYGATRTPLKSTLEKTEWEVKNEQSRYTGNIGHTRHRTKTNKTQKHNTETKKMSSRDRTKNRG